jgi:hypothetical protein
VLLESAIKLEEDREWAAKVGELCRWPLLGEVEIVVLFLFSIIYKFVSLKKLDCFCCPC